MAGSVILNFQISQDDRMSSGPPFERRDSRHAPTSNGNLNAQVNPSMGDVDEGTLTLREEFYEFIWA